MSLNETIANITKAYHSSDNDNDNDKYTLIDKEMKSDVIQNIVNLSVLDIIYKKNIIEDLIKQTGMMVADMLIKYTRDKKSKKFMINYCSAIFFKHNKYELGMMIIFNYNSEYDIISVFYYMQVFNTDINILKTVFSKYYKEFNTAYSRRWLMNGVGKYNNIELLKYVENYYKLTDTDLFLILKGTINKMNIPNGINTIKYIFENYNFYYDIIEMFYLIKELYYLEYDDAIIYVMTKLVETNGIKYVDNFLNNPEMDNLMCSIFIEYFIKVLNYNLIQNERDNIIGIVPMLKNNLLVEAIINNLNISNDDKIKINNIRFGNIVLP